MTIQYYRADSILRLHHVTSHKYWEFLWAVYDLEIHMKQTAIKIDGYYAARFIVRIEPTYDFEGLVIEARDLLEIEQWTETDQSEYDAVFGPSLLDQRRMRLPSTGNMADAMYASARRNEELKKAREYYE